MEITEIKLYLIGAGDTGARGATVGKTRYGYKVFHDIIANRATDILRPGMQWTEFWGRIEQRKTYSP